MKQAHRFSGPGRPFEGLTKPTKSGPQWAGVVRTVESALLDPISWRKPQRVFVNSMSDLFHESVPDSFIDRVFAVMALAPQHTFQVLTKRADRMRSYMSSTKGADGVICRVNAAAREIPKGRWWKGAHTSWPWSNVWLGVSAEDQQRADERIPLLLQTPAAVRFISAEPLLGPLDLLLHHDWLTGEKESVSEKTHTPRLNWVIVGGESGLGARPLDVAWVRSIVQQCQAAGVACFVKQLGSVPMMLEAEWRALSSTPILNHRNARRVPDGYVPLLMADRKGGDMVAWPDDLRVRQFPEPV
jgi:protein gp37